MFFMVIALAGVAIWAVMRRYPAVSGIRNTQAPLPSGLYTSGNAINGMAVRQRVNFQQQPTGGPTTG